MLSKLAPLRALRVRIPNQISTWLSHEAEVGGFGGELRIGAHAPTAGSSQVNAILLKQRINAALLRPDRLCQRQAIPRCLAFWRRLFQHGEQLCPQGGAMDRRLAGAPRIGQTCKTLPGQPYPPFRNRIRPAIPRRVTPQQSPLPLGRLGRSRPPAPQPPSPRRPAIRRRDHAARYCVNSRQAATSVPQYSTQRSWFIGPLPTTLANRKSRM